MKLAIRGKRAPAKSYIAIRGKVISGLAVNGVVVYRKPTWNYRLDGSWRLGEKPFLSYFE